MSTLPLVTALFAAHAGPSLGAGAEPDSPEGPAPESTEAMDADDVDDKEGSTKDGPASGEPAPKPEPGSRAARGTYASKVQGSPFDRRGWLVQGGAGISDCLGDRCKKGGWEDDPVHDEDFAAFLPFTDADTRLGPSLKFEFGLRPIEYVEATAGFTVSYQPVRGRSDHDLFGIWYTWMFQANAYPLAFSRFDPYVGFGLGFYQQWLYEDGPSPLDVDTTMWTTRGNARLTVGIDVFATDHFALGPRFDYNFPFAGEQCSDVNPGNLSSRESCEQIKDLDDDFGKGFPTHWDLSFMFKARL